MKMIGKSGWLAGILLIAMLAAPAEARAQASPVGAIPAGSKVFIAPMDDGFHDFLKAAIKGKNVPLEIVEDRSQAQFEITGHSETKKAGAAKKIFMQNWHSNEQASIQVANLESGEVVFAYSVNKQSSTHGKRSTAESCAKHLKDKIEGKK